MNAADCIRSGRHIRPDEKSQRRLVAIQRRQVRQEVWEDAHTIEPGEWLGISNG